MIILLIIMIYLDGFLLNNIPFMVNSLSILTPLLTLTTIICFSFYLDGFKTLKVAFIMGIIYDLFYTNMGIITSFMFIIVLFVIIIINNNLLNNLFNNLMMLLFGLICYEVFYYLFFIILGMRNFSLYDLFYKISHSLVLNICYGFILLLILKGLKKRKLHKNY